MVERDLDILQLKHPPNLIRDIGVYDYAKRMAKLPEYKEASLEELADKLLCRKIQDDAIDSTEKAKAKMGIYKLVEDKFERKKARNA